MGLTIILSRVTPGERYGETVEPWTGEHPEGLDRAFEHYCLKQNIDVREDVHYEGWGDVPVHYWRPKDLDAAERWVRDQDVNVETFIEAFGLMRDDPDVHFYSSR